MPLTDCEKSCNCYLCILLMLLKEKHGTKNQPSYLSDKSLGSSWAHEQHGSAQCIPVAMQLFHTHCSEQTCDHHVDIRFHLLEGYVHSLLRGPVQEIFNTTDVCRERRKQR